MKATFSIQSLGCRVNHTEADGFRLMMRQGGYQEVSYKEPADVAIVHTCTVTQMAAAKSRQAIHRVQKNKRHNAILVVTGCYAQMSESELKKDDNIDILIGTKDRHKLMEMLEEKLKNKNKQLDAVGNVLKEREYEEMPVSSFGRTRAFIKIQEGCQQFCTYCIIPFARGPVRSRKPDHIFKEINDCLEKGYKEIILTGICTGAYGRDLPQYDLADLLSAVDKLGVPRVRLGSLDPQDFNEKLFATFKNGRSFMNHFHLALQSGSDVILKRMNRGYDTDTYKCVRRRLAEIFDHLSVTTDVMVGFPGESDRDHQDSLNFVKSMSFADLHVFPYSPREGTAAASFPDFLSDEDKDQRLQDMLSLKNRSKRQFKEEQVGRWTGILVEKAEQTRNGLNLFGYSDNYQWTCIALDKSQMHLKEVWKNSIMNVQITGLDERSLKACWKVGNV